MRLTATQVEDIKRFLGLPPFDGPTNPCLHDGYFALDIRTRNGWTEEEFHEALKSFSGRATG